MLILALLTLAETLLQGDFAHACHFHSGSQFDFDPSTVAAENNKVRRTGDPASPAKTKIAIDNVRAFDGSKLLDVGTVVVDGNVIGTDPTGAQHVDGNGGVLLPGLIDSHCHPSNITHLEELSRFGVTTGLVMACYSAQLCASLQNHPGLVDIRLGSAPAAAPGSVHGNITAAVDKSGTLLVPNVTAVPQWIDQQVASHPDYIKLVAESPGLDQETLNALTLESHKRDKKVVCHAAAFDAIEQAVMAGVDHIHHAPLDKAIDACLAARIFFQNQISAPTLSIMQAIAKTLPQPSISYSTARTSVEMLRNSGVPILAGTDANLQPGLIATVPFGSSIHLELELLVDAGLSTVEALQAATSRPAKYFGLTDRGVIAPGMRADLLLVDGDPVADIKATRNIKKVWLAGVEYAGPLGVFTK